MVELYRNIKRLREEKGMSQETLAKLTGYTDRSSITKIEKGLVDLQQSKVELFAKALGTTPKHLMGWDSNTIPDYPNIHPISTQTLPMLGSIACGEPIYMDEDRESYVQLGIEVAADFCLTAKGNSMINARIHDGDIVFIRKQDMVENGEIAAVAIDDEATLKRVYYYKEQAMLILRAENPECKDQVYIKEQLNDIRILGKAIAFQSDVK